MNTRKINQNTKYKNIYDYFLLGSFVKMDKFKNYTFHLIILLQMVLFSFYSKDISLFRYYCYKLGRKYYESIKRPIIAITVIIIYRLLLYTRGMRCAHNRMEFLAFFFIIASQTESTTHNDISIISIIRMLEQFICGSCQFFLLSFFHWIIIILSLL